MTNASLKNAVIASLRASPGKIDEQSPSRSRVNDIVTHHNSNIDYVGLKNLPETMVKIGRNASDRPNTVGNVNDGKRRPVAVSNDFAND